MDLVNVFFKVDDQIYEKLNVYHELLNGAIMIKLTLE